MLKALIVDDEKHCRESLSHLVQMNCPDISSTKTANSVDAAIVILSDFKPDIVFLDIQMPGKDGFQLLPEIIDKQIAVVFTTAHDEYAVKAIQYGPAAYILKPIDIDELVEAVGFAKKMIHDKINKSKAYGSGLKMVSTGFETKSEIEKLCIVHSNKLEIVELSEILYLESDNNYTIFRMADKSRIVASKTLKTYDNILGNTFLRVHRSFLVNINYVKEFHFEDQTIVLINQKKISVARRKVAEVVARLKLIT